MKIFSGIQPTGRKHLGNYIGAIRQYVEGQDRATILEGFCLEYYTAAPSVPPQLIVPPDLTDTEALIARRSPKLIGAVAYLVGLGLHAAVASPKRV